MKKVLITGANGQLGNELKEISSNDSKFKSSRIKFTFIDIEDLDLTDPQKVKNYLIQNSFDWIINCAAYTAVDKAENEIEFAEKVNINAVKNILDGLNGSEKIIHISTDFVFDGMKNTPYSENDTVNPISVYGRTKLEGENVLKNYEKKFIIRTSWLYSTYGNNFVKTIIRLAEEKGKLGIISDQIGTPTYARDLAATILNIITLDSEKYGIYHYSNEGSASWYDFAHEICKIYELNCEVKPIFTTDYKTAASRPIFSVLNKKKVKNNFNTTVPYWRDSLEAMIHRFKDA